ncbi:MAG: DUF3575 domain-containing protein [Bacteroidales bacterium]|nr:DUF3575 domain-containing protein [Bacteroidales bacterium]
MATIEGDFAGNSARIDSVVHAAKGRELLMVEVKGFASPEGALAFNRRLATRRAENTGGLLRSLLSLPADMVRTQGMGIDQGSVEAYPRLRRSEVVITMAPLPHSSVVPSPIIEPEAVASSVDTIKMAKEVAPPEPTAPMGSSEVSMSVAPLRYPIVALRSNLLLPLLNVGAELPVGDRWSVGLDYYYPWAWRRSDHKNCFQLIFLSAEGRYWLGERHLENRLLGHSVGVYGAWGYFDIEHSWHGHQGHGYSVGADYLFAKSIAKGRLHLEFQIAVGAIWSRGAQCYDVLSRGGHLIRERGHKKNWNYVGPTKVAVSLVLPLFKKVTPKPVSVL